MENKKINIRKQLFNWHMWAGIIFAIPVVLVSLTAILIAHEKGLGTKNVLVTAGWMPGYQSDAKDMEYYLDDIKAFAQSGNIQYYGTKAGVLMQTDAGLEVVNGTEGKEVRDLTTYEGKLLIASKYGLFELANGKTTQIAKGDFHGIHTEGELLVASLGKHGLLTSNDGGIEWVESGKFSKTIPADQLAIVSGQLMTSGHMEEVALEKLVLDIHTGKAFFGEGAMWIWIDLIGLSLLLMTITGIWMWYKRKYGKPKKSAVPARSSVRKSIPVMMPIMKPVINT